MSNIIRKSLTRRSDDTMDYDSDDKDSKRKSRNLSEKKRRDQFNMLINELSSMVSTSVRKMDKSTVLKSTISFLKSHNEIALRSRENEIQEDWKPSFLTNEEFTHLVLEAVDGFIMVFSTSGHIFYASESITSLLGHLPNGLLGMNIYELSSEEDQSSIYNILLNPSVEEGQVSFSCYLRRGKTDINEPTYYELVHFVGYFRSDEDMIQGDNRFSGYSGEADTRLVFIGTGRLHIPQLIKELPVVDNSRSEFTSRHSLEWKYLFLDHRAPPIIGYLPFELLGTSGYDYYHVEDLEKIVTCHKSLMLKGEGTSCYYRFLTKGQQWIWLQSRYYITYHQWTSKPEFVVCTHRVVSYADVLKQASEGGDETPVFEDYSSFSANDSSTSWSRKHKSSTKHGTESDPSMSPLSRQSVVTQHSVKSKASHTNTVSSSNNRSHTHIPAQQLPQQPSTSAQPQLQELQIHTQLSQPDMPQLQHTQQLQMHPLPQTQQLHTLQIPQSMQQAHHQPFQHQIQTYPIQSLHQPHPQQFLDSPQYVAALPVQQVLAGFSSPTVLSPLQAVDNVIMSPAQSQLQTDLQRKHAELQALIGQQQVELRRVSEQLLMARLGLLPSTAQPIQTITLPQYPTSNPTVSSTTMTLHELTPAVTGSPVMVTGTTSLSVLQPQQQDLLFNLPDSNCQLK